MTLSASVLIASGFQVQKQDGYSLNFTKISDAVPFTLRSFDIHTNELITENFLIDKHSKTRTDIKLADLSFSQFGSKIRYYDDRLIMSEHGGKSVELVKESTGDLKVNQYNFEIVSYDAKQKKYVTRPSVRGTKKGLYILDEKMSQERLIPLPVAEEEFMNGGSLEAYNLDTIV